MKKGDIVYLSYTGRIKETGEIFDVTDEETAKKEGVYNPEVKYGDIPVIVGAGFLLPGLDEALLEMKPGEKRHIELTPSKAFGERRPELVKLLPLSEFEKQNIEATPGSYITVNGVRGRILSVSGGRVSVDFNHPLAGKTLSYDIEIKRAVEKTEEKILAVVKYFTGADDSQISLSISNSTAEVEIKGMEIAKRVKNAIVSTVFQWVEGIEKVRFVESYSKQEFKAEKKK